jgi:hypothetical protein
LESEDHRPPRRPGTGIPALRPTLAEPSRGRRFLRRELPDSWRFALQMATDLGRQVEYLAWTERARTFDKYFVRQAEAMLRNEGLTELVTGPGTSVRLHGGRGELEERARRFAAWSRATVTALLLDLDERIEITNAEQALTYLLSRDIVLAKAAARWTARHGNEPIAQALENLPGYAVVLLASSPNDTAGRFMARDAFWVAVLGR